MFLHRCIEKLVHYLERITTAGRASVDAKEMFSGFTIDVIASTAFATETNANDDRSKKSPFVVNGLNLLKVVFWKAIAVFAFPRFINRLLGVKTASPDSSTEFIVQLCKQIVDQRKRDPDGAKRHDLVQLMMDSFVYEHELTDSNYDKLTVSLEETDGKTDRDDNRLMMYKSI